MFQQVQDDEPLHIRASLSQVMQARRQRMRDEINHLPEARLKSEPVERLAEEMAEKFSINIPVLDEASIRPASREVDIDFFRDPTRRCLLHGTRGHRKGNRRSP